MTDNIRVFTQNSIRIETDKAVIYVDPFQIKSEFFDAGYIFITHDHFDHFSPESIEKVADDDTVLIVPEHMKQDAQNVSHLVKDIITVNPGSHIKLDKVEFDTVASYNMIKPYHPKGAGWCGYIIYDGDKRIYVAGDTDAVKEVRDVRCDVALVPIGGKYTMDAKKAASLINEIEPKVAIPVHYGSVVGSPKDAEVFKKHVKDSVKVELKIEFD